MTKYNGHKSWAYWNVSLWIGNHEGLYTFAKHCIRTSRTKDIAARKMIAELPKATPDGARYSVSAVRAALTGL